MQAVEIAPGSIRGPQDGSRRFTPFDFKFDTRALMLNTVIEDEWETSIRAQWQSNQSRVREVLIHELGADAYERKIQDFIDLGSAPWSVVALHNVYLAQVRSAFASTYYYPSLLGACGLGERILNQLVLTLRDDFPDHDATAAVRNQPSFDKWKLCITTLRSWGVFDEAVAAKFTKLMRRRHGAVHYRTSLDGGDARSEALEAVLLLGEIVESLFSPLGDRPWYFSGPIGRSYIRLHAESDPFVKKFILPACVLVSPIYRFVHSGLSLAVYDDPGYGADQPPLSDEEFAEPVRASAQVPYPF